MKKDFYLGFYNWILNKFYQRDTLGLKMPQTAGSKAACSKCGFKHNRPVGIRCKRALNSSAPTLRDANNSDEEGVAERSQQLNTEAVPGQAVASSRSSLRRPELLVNTTMCENTTFKHSQHRI